MRRIVWCIASLLVLSISCREDIEPFGFGGESGASDAGSAGEGDGGAPEGGTGGASSPLGGAQSSAGTSNVSGAAQGGAPSGGGAQGGASASGGFAGLPPSAGEGGAGGDGGASGGGAGGESGSGSVSGGAGGEAGTSSEAGAGGGSDGPECLPDTPPFCADASTLRFCTLGQYATLSCDDYCLGAGHATGPCGGEGQTCQCGPALENAKCLRGTRSLCNVCQPGQGFPKCTYAEFIDYYEQCEELGEASVASCIDDYVTTDETGGITDGDCPTAILWCLED